MNLLSFQLQKLPCLSIVLLCLEFTIRMIESACTSLHLTNLDPLLCKKIEVSSDIHVRLEVVICE